MRWWLPLRLPETSQDRSGRARVQDLPGTNLKWGQGTYVTFGLFGFFVCFWVFFMFLGFVLFLFFGVFFGGVGGVGRVGRGYFVFVWFFPSIIKCISFVLKSVISPCPSQPFFILSPPIPLFVLVKFFFYLFITIFYLIHLFSISIRRILLTGI